jgi:hypothetical protein
VHISGGSFHISEKKKKKTGAKARSRALTCLRSKHCGCSPLSEKEGRGKAQRGGRGQSI